MCYPLNKEKDIIGFIKWENEANRPKEVVNVCDKMKFRENLFVYKWL